MTRKISRHDGDLIVNDEVELSGEVTGQLVVEPGGSAVIHGSVVGSTLSVGSASSIDGSTLSADSEPEVASDRHRHDDLSGVISEIP